MSSALVPMSSILPTKEILEAMARRRYQRPNVLTSTTKRPYFYFRYRAYSPSGEKAMQREQFIGWCDEISKKRAKEIRDEWLKGVNNVPLALQSQVPFADFVDIWRRTTLGGLKERTRVQYESALKVHILPRFGKMRLCDVTREAVQEWRAALLAAMAPDSARNVLRQLYNIFSVADDLGYWSGRNPADKTKIKAESPERELITPGEYLKLLARIEEPWNLAVRIATETGLRIGEIRGLEWRDVDLAGGLIHVRRQMPQNGDTATLPKTRKSTRTVPIGALVDDLRRMQGQGSDRILPTICYSSTRNIIKAAAKDAEITARRFGWHTLRHLHSTWMRDQGADALDVRDQLGHTRLETTTRYTRNEMARRAAAVVRLQTWITSGAVQ